MISLRPRWVADAEGIATVSAEADAHLLRERVQTFTCGSPLSVVHTIHFVTAAFIKKVAVHTSIFTS